MSQPYDPFFILLMVSVFLALVNMWFVFSRGARARREREENKRDIALQADRLSAIMERLERVDQGQDRINQNVDSKLENIHRAGQNQFREAREIIGEITLKSDRLIENVSKRLGDLDKTNQKIVDFSAQIKDLGDVLKNPKQRGVMGEYILEHVLANALPPTSYKMQHGFSGGEVVDAAVYVKEKIVPIDAKFSLENYERFLASETNADRDLYQKAFRQDLKKRIDETSKYIRPDEGTTDFAFMFIPSEAIYYDLLVNTVGSADAGSVNMIEYAFRDKHVVIVSPTSFLAYLQTVLQGLRALEIEDNAKQIKKRIAELSRHWSAFDLYMQKLQKSMGVSVNHFNSAYKELGKVDRDVMRITDRSDRTIVPGSIDRPQDLD